MEMNTSNAAFAVLFYSGCVAAVYWLAKGVAWLLTRPPKKWPRQHHPAYWRDWK